MIASFPAHSGWGVSLRPSSHRSGALMSALHGVVLEQQFRRVAQGLGAGLDLVGLPSVLRLHLPAFGLPVLHRGLALGELGAPLPGRTTMITPASTLRCAASI